MIISFHGASGAQFKGAGIHQAQNQHPSHCNIVSNHSEISSTELLKLSKLAIKSSSSSQFGLKSSLSGIQSLSLSLL